MPFSSMLLAVFIAAAALLWLSMVGYVLLLVGCAWRRVPVDRAISEWPSVAVVIPTLNEEQMIEAKIADLARSDYPADRLDIIIVDGGSRDRTVADIDAAIAAGARLQLWRVAGGKAQQINYALQRLHHEIVVVSDADARLEPSCIRELVRHLVVDPRTAIVGASIRVDTTLAEERLHWRAVNRLWWLEGEAFSAAVVSGVCYAARRTAVAAVAHDASAEDVHISLSATKRGLRVRLCRTAWATETRVPHTVQDLLRFRRRRGTGYLRELRRRTAVHMPVAARVAHWSRLIHFHLTPIIAAAAAVSGALLLGTPQWRWPILVGAWFAVPVVVVTHRARDILPRHQWWRLPLVVMRWLGLLWVSLLAVRASASPRSEFLHLNSDAFPAANPEQVGS